MSDYDPYKPPEVRVDDPITEKKDFVLARRFARLAGRIADALLYIGVMWGFVFFGTWFLDDVTPVLAVFVTFTPAVALFVVNMVLLHKRGQTLGKMAVKTKIVRTNGERASLGRIFGLRMLAPGLLSAIPIIGYLFALADALLIFTSERRCLHDHMADTIVIEA